MTRRFLPNYEETFESIYMSVLVFDYPKPPCSDRDEPTYVRACQMKESLKRRCN